MNKQLKALTLHRNTLSRISYNAALLALMATCNITHAAPVLGTPQNDVSLQTSWSSVGIGGDSCGPSVISGSGPVFNSCSSGSPPLGFSYPLSTLATATASAGAGVVRAATMAFAVAEGPASIGSDAYAGAQATDYLAISGPANSTGVVHGSFVISGSLFAGASGTAGTNAAGSTYSVQTSFGSMSGYWTSGSNGYNAQSNVSGGVLSVDTPIYFGPDGWAPVTLSIYAQLQSNAAALLGNSLTSANFENTIYWGGISSITVNDAPLTNYQLISASGADYRYATAPVPIPAAVWLFGSGLLGLIGIARRKACAA